MDVERQRFRKHTGIAGLLSGLMINCKNLTVRKQLSACMSLDLGKVWDSVWVNRLLWKLKNIGNSGNLFGLLRSFLKKTGVYLLKLATTNLTFRTYTRVPQGAALLGILFINIFFRNCFSGRKAEGFKLADDGNFLISANNKVELEE